MAAILNVPLFLVAIFLLQTRFRPEMQEDSFYSKYLGQKLHSPAEGVEKQIADLSLKFGEFSARSMQIFGIVEGQVKQLQAAKPPKGFVLEAETDRLINRIKREASWDAFLVNVNGMLPQYQKIKECLISAEIPIANIFGNEKLEVPKKFVLSFDYKLPIPMFQDLLSSLLPAGLDGIASFDEGDDLYRVHRNHVFVGSYVWGAGTYTPLTAEVTARLLSPTLLPQELSQYVLRQNDGEEFSPDEIF